MKVAVLYQDHEPPAIGGLRKPMKPGGYRDSGADIAYCLHEHGVEVATPIPNPDLYTDLDWVFPDTVQGIHAALAAGADTLWLNTVLYDGHPIEQFAGVYVVGQRPADVARYDDKFTVNAELLKRGFPVIKSQTISAADEYIGRFPRIIKPIRGRGSQGVVRCDTPSDFAKTRDSLLTAEIYGNTLMAEPYLPGQEITISVFPDGTSLPIAERFAQKNGVAPYNGDVPVTENSRAVTEETAAQHTIHQACEQAVLALDLKGLVRIDCRADADGTYYMFDFNPKPNLTGAARQHRTNQNCLTMISAAAQSWSYFDLLRKMLESRWQL